jgi:hypothetical protein
VTIPPYEPPQPQDPTPSDPPQDAGYTPPPTSDYTPPPASDYTPPASSYTPPPTQGYTPPGGYTPPQQYAAQPAGGTPPQNYLVWAILTTVFCCLPLGIASIVFSTQVNSKWAAGDYAGAQDSSEKAKKFAMIGAILGVVVIVLYAIFMGVMIAASGY